MTPVLLRSILILSIGLAGLYLGFWMGAYSTPRGAGLAGGAIVLGYAVMGFVGCAVAGTFISFRLQPRTLRNASLIIGAPVVILYLVLTVNALTKAAAEREPDEAFAPAGEFTVTMERVDRSDPYLFIQMHVDSNSRKWEQTGPAPENKVCSAKIKSKDLIEIRAALDALLALGKEKLADCTGAGEPLIKRLRWHLIDGQMPQGGSSLPQKGSLDVNATCLRQYFEIGRTFSLVEKISLQSNNKVTCE